MSWYMKIIPITHANSHIFEVFEQDYEAEFSAITQKEPSAEGCFTVEADWRAPNRGFYLFTEEKPAGFVIRGEIENYSDIGEFYILPCYRRRGLGKILAYAVFDFFPGLWQVRQIPTATHAIMFWRKVIHEYTNGNYREDQLEDSHWGTVIRQRFEANPFKKKIEDCPT